jgi:polar amino acid transport system ATP-binding protein
MSALVRLNNVTKIFRSGGNDVFALQDVSFDVQPGEVICLLGPSGSGKSTCLRTINALETISGGTIEVCGHTLSQPKVAIHEIRRNTAMIFQRFELFPHLTALENVALAPRLVLKKSKDEAFHEAKENLCRVGLGDHLDKYPNAISGGQQQRVAIARALAINPKVLLCDEPTSALDPELVNEVLEILTDIAKNGMTMIIVTHEMNFAAQVSNRCFFLDKGKIVEQGPTRSFFEDPSSTRLKQFLRQMKHNV